MTENLTIPLCVDLDGTLVKNDTLYQAFFLLLRHQPACLFRLPGWLRKGRAFLKEQIMQRVELDVISLPYNQPLLAELRRQHTTGRTLVLATAANKKIADAVADHLGIFSKTLASTAEINLRGAEKLAAIRAHFPHFAYAGNAAADFPLFEAAEEIILANPTAAAAAHYGTRATALFIDRRPTAQSIIKAIRYPQWLKNILIFAPMLLAHRFTDPILWFQAVRAFFAFSCAASAIYVLNDLFDLSADQHHPRKRNRPFAAGDLQATTGLLLIPLLTLLSLGLCIGLPSLFAVTLLSYFAITTLYSWHMKQQSVADVLCLAVLFALRIFAGAAATNTTISVWFIEFAIFFFLSLALLKRTAELREVDNTANEEEHAWRERGYTSDDLPILLAFGAAAGFIAVLVFTFYLGSEKVSKLYRHPEFLWTLCALMLYWITRIWHLAWRGQIHDDPLAFTSKDPQSYFLGLLGLAILLCAI